MAAIDPVELTRALVARPSVTPHDAGALEILAGALKSLGFRVEPMRFEEPGEAPVDNLYARFGEAGPNFCFAGHTDVVPTGPTEAWSAPPFAAEIRDGTMIGRGVADMKGAIAAFVAAAAGVIAAGKPPGSISLLITGDEEGPAINGTRKMLALLAARGERIDHCLVGEPSGAAALGDTIKIGRRGSLNGWITVEGRQGHVAYPERALNPIPPLARIVSELSQAPLDAGYEAFQSSNLEVTDLQVGNPAHNVIPASASARFNIRFNPTWTGAALEAHLKERIAAMAERLGVGWRLKTVVSGEAFLTREESFIALLSDSVESVVGRRPVLSTTGGTSDARFIKDHAPVAELGLVGATIHQIDERTSLADIADLTRIYAAILQRYFGRGQ